MWSPIPLLVLSALAAGPDPVDSSASPPSGDPVAEMAIGANSHLLAGRPVSVGPDWFALYGAEGMTFTPALGPEAPVTRRVRWSFESVAVGGRTLPGVDRSVTPELEDDQVVFSRGAGLREIYVARPEGLEQMFELQSLPTRGGDLVIRGRLETDLPMEPRTGADGLRLAADGQGGVRIGGVLAIDSDGARSPGHLNLGDGWIELVVPAEFVERARLPLLVDPLFGVDVVPGSAGEPLDQVDVAFGDNGLFAEYALAYRVQVSASDTQIFAATFTADGSTGLTPLLVDDDLSKFDSNPTIAYNRPNGKFAVAFERIDTLGFNEDVWLNSFDLTTGAVDTAVPVATGSGFQGQPDLGGESQTSPDFDLVVVVYQNSGAIEAAAIDVSSDPALVNTALVDGMGLSCSNPAITQSGGDFGQYFVVAQQDFGLDHDLIVGVVDEAGNSVTSSVGVPTIGPDETLPDVAGVDGEGLVAFQREAVAGNGDADVIAWKLEFDFTGLTVDTQDIEVAALVGRSELEPAVGWSDDEYVVAFATGGSFTTDTIRYRTVGAVGCTLCEPETLVGTGGGNNRRPEIATRVGAGYASPEDAAIAFDQVGGVFSQDSVAFQLWVDDDGGAVPTLVPGGCFGGGSIGHTGSTAIGSGDFALTLDNPDPSAFAVILNINGVVPAVQLGTCAVLPQLLTFTTTPTPPVIGPEATLTLGIPCVSQFAGKSLAFQWYVLGTTSSPSGVFPNVAFSDQLILPLSF